VENFVDNLPALTRRASAGGLAGPGARKYGMKNFFVINRLHRRDAALRPTTVASASAGAAVELSRGAGRRFVDG
jgi:hypothetical protein